MRRAGFEVRGLSAGEALLLTGHFGPAFPAARVRIVATPLPVPAAVVPLGMEIVFGGPIRPPADIARADAGWQGLLVHEAAHVWQAACGIVLALAKLSAIGRAAYRYDPARGLTFWAHNIEQQAEIARHAFWRQHGITSPLIPPGATPHWLTARMDECRRGRAARA